eukprot:Em0004g958a
MDFGVGCANLVGILYDYESHLRNSSDQSSRILTDSAQRMCQAQAFLADWCTHSSIIWTILLPAYLYLLVTYQRSTHTKYVFLSFYFFGYGVPLISSLWLLLTHRLGYAPYNSAGWCTVQVTDISGRNPNIYLTAMSYDLWIYLSFVLVPVFCLAVHLRIRDKLKTPDETGLSQMTVKALYHVHYKFLAIPAIFILLRVWSCIVNIALVYGAFANLRCDWLFVLTLLSGFSTIVPLVQRFTTITGAGVHYHHWCRGSLPSLVQGFTTITGAGVHYHHWCRGSLPSLVQGFTTITGAGVHYHHWCRGSLPSCHWCNTYAPVPYSEASAA